MENMDVGLVEVEAVINEAEAEPDEPANIGAMVHAAAVFVLNKGKDLAHVIWGNKEKVAAVVLVSTVTSVDLVWAKWWGIVRVNIFSRWSFNMAFIYLLCSSSHGSMNVPSWRSISAIVRFLHPKERSLIIKAFHIYDPPQFP